MPEIKLATLNDKQITINRTPAFFSTAQALSDYLNRLLLTSEQNNRLVELMVAHVQTAERCGFYAGYLFAAGDEMEGTGNVFS